MEPENFILNSIKDCLWYIELKFSYLKEFLDDNSIILRNRCYEGFVLGNGGTTVQSRRVYDFKGHEVVLEYIEQISKSKGRFERVPQVMYLVVVGNNSLENPDRTPKEALETLLETVC